jgi:hypothetical protein
MKITKISVFKKSVPYISGELEVGDRSSDCGQLSDWILTNLFTNPGQDHYIAECSHHRLTPKLSATLR